MSAQRKPDHVFNVWGDGEVTSDSPSAFVWSAKAIEAENRNYVDPEFQITHRILVRMKPAKPPVEPSSTPTIPEGFIPHHGGPCPVAEGTRVVVLWRDGVQSDPHHAYAFAGWEHHAGASFRIIAYRIERDPSFKVEAGKFYITASGKRVGPMRDYEGIAFDIADDYEGLWDEDGDDVLLCRHDLLALAADQTSPMVSE